MKDYLIRTIVILILGWGMYLILAVRAPNQEQFMLGAVTTISVQIAYDIWKMLRKPK